MTYEDELNRKALEKAIGLDPNSPEGVNFLLLSVRMMDAYCKRHRADFDAVWLQARNEAVYAGSTLTPSAATNEKPTPAKPDPAAAKRRPIPKFFPSPDFSKC